MPKQKKKTRRKKRSLVARDLDKWHPNACLDVVPYYAATGEVDMAFLLLEAAVRKGFRDCHLLTKGKLLGPLRKDKRWPAIVDRCKANRAAYLESINLELYRMEQRFSRERNKEGLDPDVLEKRNARRRKRVRRMLESGTLRVSDDFERAAWILCCSSDPSDCQLARTLALKAAKLDPEDAYARALAAMVEDRYLLSIGKPQIYGTKFRTIRGKSVLEEPYDLSSIADEERKELFGLIMYRMIKSAHQNSEDRKRRSRKPRSRRSKKARK